MTATATPAGAATPRASAYKLTSATGVVRVSFQGTPDAGCARRGQCGVAGTVEYRFGGRPRSSDVTLIEQRRGTFGFGSFTTRGATAATVTTPGASAPCRDRVSHRLDGFGLVQTSRTRIQLRLHDAEADANYLATRCAGPRDSDLGVPLVKASLPLRIFRARRLSFTATGSRPFRRAGFEGTTTWDLAYRMTGARCNPNCHRGIDRVTGERGS